MDEITKCGDRLYCTKARIVGKMQLKQRGVIGGAIYQLGSVGISSQVRYQISLVEQVIELKETNDREPTKGSSRLEKDLVIKKVKSE